MITKYARRCPRCDGPLIVQARDAEPGVAPKVLEGLCCFCDAPIKFDNLPSVEILEVLADPLGWSRPAAGPDQHPSGTAV